MRWKVGKIMVSATSNFLSCRPEKFKADVPEVPSSNMFKPKNEPKSKLAQALNPEPIAYASRKDQVAREEKAPIIVAPRMGGLSDRVGQ